MKKKRSVVNKFTDKNIFRRTANRTKKLNSSPPTFRGGIRL